MRKLSKLLPIARSLLTTGNGGGEEYTCWAAEVAYERGFMTYDEQRNLQGAIVARLDSQHPGRSAIASLAVRAGVVSRTRHPEYISFRDKWLDEMQSDLLLAGD